MKCWKFHSHIGYEDENVSFADWYKYTRWKHIWNNTIWYTVYNAWDLLAFISAKHKCINKQSQAVTSQTVGAGVMGTGTSGLHISGGRILLCT